MPSDEHVVQRTHAAARVFLIVSMGALMASVVHGLFHYTSFSEQVIRALF
jgi:hypothetical protein